MSPPLSYSEMIKQVKLPYDLRLRLVESARRIGIKPTARLYGTSPQTVRLWLRRYAQEGRQGLPSHSHAPHSCPHRTPVALEEEIVRLRAHTGFGARRLRVEFELPVSEGAIARILRQRGLVRPRKKKHKTKQDLRERKAAWAVFSKFCHDTKDLDDIPHYFLQAKALGLPIIQYTAREVRTGLTFADYAQERSAALACVFAERVIAHLEACGVPLEEVGFQTDNGCEYTGGKDHRGVPHGFKPTVHPPLTLSTATWRRCIGCARTSSSTGRTSAPDPTSWPRSTPTGATSTWPARTATRAIAAHWSCCANWRLR